MTRGLTNAQVAAATAANVAVVPLVELWFDSGVLRLTLAPWNVDSGGQTYYATGGLASLDAVDESADSTEGVRFSLSGLSPEIISIVAAEPYRGRLFQLKELWLDADTHQPIGSARAEWVGRLTVLSVSETGGDAVVTGQAEHYEAELRRPRVSRYNDADQQRLFPGDKGFDMVEALADELKLVWPSKEALRQ